LRIGGLAANVQMSVFAFHHRFRRITAMSPLLDRLFVAGRRHPPDRPEPLPTTERRSSAEK